MTAGPFTVESAPDFGPDFSNTAPEMPAETPEPEPVKVRKTTRASGKAAQDDGGLFGKLGKNSPARSSVRQLTEADQAALAKYYVRAGGMIRYAHPRLGNVMVECADECAESWIKLAAKNVKVRAKILAILEGGELLGVIMAHSPLLIAVLPEQFVASVMFRASDALSKLFNSSDDEHGSSDDEQQTWQQPFFAAQDGMRRH